jgi:hypothetical protein
MVDGYLDLRRADAPDRPLADALLRPRQVPQLGACWMRAWRCTSWMKSAKTSAAVQDWIEAMDSWPDDSATTGASTSCCACAHATCWSTSSA